jgi:hypothetical protein
MLVIVASYNMEKYLTNTLFSLSKYYQDLEDYEVITLNNGGEEINENFFYKFGKNFKYKYIEKSKSHVHPYVEINKIIENSNHEKIVIICDGARICSKNILKDYMKILSENDYNVCTCPSYHLGFDLQRKSVESGYNNNFETNILKRSRWWLEDSTIFDISVFGGSSDKNVFNKLQVESNCIGMSKKTFLEIGGFSDKFNIPGGGQINIEFFQRLISKHEINIYYFVNHGTFHQLHGGMSANSQNFHLQKQNELGELKRLNIEIDIDRIKNRKFIAVTKGPKRKLVLNKKINIDTISSLKKPDDNSYKIKGKIKEMYLDYILKLFKIQKMKIRVFLENNNLGFIVKFYRAILFKKN